MRPALYASHHHGLLHEYSNDVTWPYPSLRWRIFLSRWFVRNRTKLSVGTILTYAWREGASSHAARNTPAAMCALTEAPRLSLMSADSRTVTDPVGR
jgi:hypothetical protein